MVNGESRDRDPSHFNYSATVVVISDVRGPETRRVHTNLTSSAPRFCVNERGNSLFFVVEKE